MPSELLTEVIEEMGKLQLEYLGAIETLKDTKPYITVVDIRGAPFQKCLHVIRSTYLSLILLQDHVIDPKWWKDQFPAVPDKERRVYTHEFETFHRIAFLNLFHLAIDSSMRTLSRAIDSAAAKAGTDNTANVNSFVLGRLGLKKYRGVLCIITLLRNVGHNNGRHTEATVTLTFKGKPYQFEKDKEPVLYAWLPFIELAREVRSMFLEIAASKVLPPATVEDPNALEMKKFYDQYFASQEP
jgi:hypothetical protein